MKILKNNNDLNEALKKESNLGFVPTMGSLHKGHISLIKLSKKNCKKTIVSIFINPTQFNNRIDYINYPNNLKKDLSLLRKFRVNYIYLPKKIHIYNFKRKRKIRLLKKDKILCAKFRRNHFEGVLDVMDRLTNQIRPRKIFMGEKDFQQLYLVKNYIQNKYNTKIISCKTIRNKNNVALSSRNLLLKKKEINIASLIINDLFDIKKTLKKQKKIKFFLKIKKRMIEKKYNIKIEYLELRNKYNLKFSKKITNSRLFIAYYLKKVRLIDNI